MTNIQKFGFAALSASVIALAAASPASAFGGRSGGFGGHAGAAAIGSRAIGGGGVLTGRSVGFNRGYGGGFHRGYGGRGWGGYGYYCGPIRAAEGLCGPYGYPYGY